MKTKSIVIISFVLNLAFAGLAYTNGNSHEHHASGHFKPSSLIELLGALTFLSLISTFIVGKLMPKNRMTLFPWHKQMAVITVILASTHVIMVLIFH